MTLLSHAQIDAACNYIKDKMPVYYNAQYIACLIMYQTGCRAKESIDPSKWEVFGTDTIILHPQKGNDSRLFLRTDLPAQLLQIIDNNPTYFDPITYRKLEYAINQLIYHCGIHIDGKDTVCHLFRHNYVKKLLDTGHTAEQIKTKLGERTMKATESYINSQVIARNFDAKIFE